jgi:DNA-binding MarR family transcriptional regulator
MEPNENILYDEKYDLWWLIITTRRAIGKVRSRELYRLGITYEESAVLHSIIELEEPVTPSKLSRHLFREPHSTSKILERMEKKGLVNRETNYVGRKTIKVGLTEKGLSVLSKAAEPGCVQRIISTISTAKQTQLGEILTKLRENAIRELGIYYQP